MFSEIEFREGETQHFVEIEVLFDGVREMREAFTVHLKPDENMVAEIQVTSSRKVPNSKIWQTDLLRAFWLIILHFL